MGFLDMLRNIFNEGNSQSSSSNYTYQTNTSNEEADCRGKESVICARIEQIAADDWPSYELRKNIPATDFGGSPKDHGFAYGLYKDGQPKLMIMILEQYQYRNASVIRAHAACKSQGVASFHLMKHLPNRKSYIADRMKALLL